MMGTTVDLNTMSQPNQICQGAYFDESPGTRGSATKTDVGDDDKRDTWDTEEDQQAALTSSSMDKAVRTDVEEMILPPSSVVSGAVGGGGTANKDNKGHMPLIRLSIFSFIFIFNSPNPHSTRTRP